ncbi:MAG: hypothetical protein QOF51_3206 [Chloroflexota bacterium]|nr:hypothetical protein [Chloroflexota bacterium]
MLTIALFALTATIWHTTKQAVAQAQEASSAEPLTPIIPATISGASSIAGGGVRVCTSCTVSTVDDEANPEEWWATPVDPGDLDTVLPDAVGDALPASGDPAATLSRAVVVEAATAEDEDDAVIDADDEAPADLAASRSVEPSSRGGGRPLSSAGQDVASFARTLTGIVYAWGGTSPATGFDCSGLVWYVYRQFGVTLGRDSTAQAYNGTAVGRDQLEPGDVILFANTYTSGISHTGIYIGDGQFVHAVQPGVSSQIASLSDGYWGRDYAGARRILQDE